jgi:ATP-dependent protease ClpP protease subunit
MKLARIVICGVLGYIFGYQLATCSKAWGQVRQNAQVLLDDSNSVIFRGEVNTDSVQSIQFELATLVLKRGFVAKPLYLVLDSPGGDIEAGIQLIEFAKTIPNLRTLTIFSASMAADIVESLPGLRYITNNGNLMFHRAKGAFQGQFEVGEVESRLNVAKKMVLGLEIQNANRLGISLIEFKARIKDEYWLDADASIKAHAADKIVDIVCSKELLEKRVKMEYFTILGPVSLVFSGCPTFRAPILSDTAKELLLKKEPIVNKVIKKLKSTK